MNANAVRGFAIAAKHGKLEVLRRAGDGDLYSLRSPPSVDSLERGPQLVASPWPDRMPSMECFAACAPPMPPPPFRPSSEVAEGEGGPRSRRDTADSEAALR